jgi:hypothetical protein
LVLLHGPDHAFAGRSVFVVPVFHPSECSRIILHHPLLQQQQDDASVVENHTTSTKTTTTRFYSKEQVFGTTATTIPQVKNNNQNSEEWKYLEHLLHKRVTPMVSRLYGIPTDAMVVTDLYFTKTTRRTPQPPRQSPTTATTTISSAKTQQKQQQPEDAAPFDISIAIFLSEATPPPTKDERVVSSSRSQVNGRIYYDPRPSFQRRPKRRSHHHLDVDHDDDVDDDQKILGMVSAQPGLMIVASSRMPYSNAGSFTTLHLQLRIDSTTSSKNSLQRSRSSSCSMYSTYWNLNWWTVRLGKNYDSRADDNTSSTTASSSSFSNTCRIFLFQYGRYILQTLGDAWIPSQFHVLVDDSNRTDYVNVLDWNFDGNRNATWWPTTTSITCDNRKKKTDEPLQSPSSSSSSSSSSTTTTTEPVVTKQSPTTTTMAADSREEL